MDRALLLVPLDTSPEAEAVLLYVEPLACATTASVLLLSVLEPRDFGTLPEEALADIDGERLRTRTAYLEKVAARLRGQGLHVTTMTAAGAPADEIIAAADDLDAGLVAMTAHGHGGAARPGMGQTAERVVRLGHRPVLIVPGLAEGARAPVHIRHIMAPLDGSSAAEAAYCPAAELAQALDARLALVRAQPWLSPITVPYSHLPGLSRGDEHAGLVAEHYLEQVQERGPDGVRTETFVLRGAPREELVRFAQEEDIDLTVMATRGRGGMGRRLLGSTAERMVRAGLPVLLIPPRPVTPAEQAAERAARPHCATCGRIITLLVTDSAVCPRCRLHLHRCANCALWDGAACLLQRPEAHSRQWAGRACPRFALRADRDQQSPGSG